jgi:hypothetical protein
VPGWRQPTLPDRCDAIFRGPNHVDEETIRKDGVYEGRTKAVAGRLVDEPQAAFLSEQVRKACADVRPDFRTGINRLQSVG